MNTTIRPLVPSLLALVAFSLSAQEPPEARGSSPVTVFEGARVIVGDGSAPLDDAVLVVDGQRFAAVGAAGDVEIPAGATRVDLSGMTVMPAIHDTHVHLSRERDALIDDLRRRAYFGVVSALSLGMDEGDVPFAVRDETIPGAASAVLCDIERPSRPPTSGRFGQ